MPQPALFLDRDGVINVDHGYVWRIEDFTFVPGIIELLLEAQAKGLLLVVVTNQSGLARGYFSLEDYVRLQQHLYDELAKAGICLTAVYYCPHYPDGAVPELAIRCSCRKPQAGMLIRAAREYDIDLERSIMIGDKPSDLAAARAAGVGQSYLVDPTANDEERFAEPLAAVRLAWPATR